MKKIHLLVLIILTLAACSGGGSQPTAADVITAFKDAGLEAEDTRPLTKEDYGVAPYVCTGTRFFIPSVGAERGGRVFICDNDKDRDTLATYYTELGKSSAAFFSWVFVKGSVLVQITGDVPEETARKYETALNEIK